MRRGEIWTVAAGTGYAGKPRPAVIVQDDRFDTDSVTRCLFTTVVSLSAVRHNGLREPSRLMADKLTTVARSLPGDRLGVLDGADILRLEQSFLAFLGVAG